MLAARTGNNFSIKPRLFAVRAKINFQSIFSVFSMTSIPLEDTEAGDSGLDALMELEFSMEHEFIIIDKTNKKW